MNKVKKPEKERERDIKKILYLNTKIINYKKLKGASLIWKKLKM